MLSLQQDWIFAKSWIKFQLQLHVQESHRRLVQLPPAPPFLNDDADMIAPAGKGFLVHYVVRTRPPSPATTIILVGESSEATWATKVPMAQLEAVNT